MQPDQTKENYTERQLWIEVLTATVRTLSSSLLFMNGLTTL